MASFKLILVRKSKIGESNSSLVFFSFLIFYHSLLLFRQNDGPAVIVFDVMGLLNITLQSNIDLLLGGRHHIVLSKYEDFFLKLKQEYGAELVFFCDGRVQQVCIARMVRIHSLTLPNDSQMGSYF